MDEDALLRLTHPLREAFARTGFTADGVLAGLESEVHDALGRGEPTPVRRRCRDLGELGTLIRLFLLADDVDADAARAALAPVERADAERAGLLAGDAEGTVRALLDVRPLDLGHGTRWVVSDIDGSTRDVPIGSDHVLGVGHASLSLVRATPTRTDGPVSLLDLGTGCGVQAVHGSTYADRVTATDLSARAVVLARVTAALNRTSVEVLAGPWFEPVVGRRFDRIVANPPFVVGTGDVTHSYRDSGLDLDGASRLVVSTAPDHLHLGGTAALLAAWIHVDGEDWRSRVASWLPDHGVDAWIVQRDVADPALHVGTWLRDGGLDPRTPAADALAERWLSRLEDADVTGVGFGFVYLRRTDRPTSVLAEDLRHGLADPLGDEALDVFDRLDWLRTHDLVAERFTVDPATAYENVALPDPDGGWSTVVRRVHRGDGPAWQHEIDEDGATLLAGLRADGLPLGDVVELLAAARGVDADELMPGAVSLVSGLVVHGLVRPAGSR
ncbi:DUF7782 domain-containing protein [Rhodococcoides corynebacterioides]|uniref:Methyltransferase n=1 Tax=Rhodococcoides corynebacterioides TaxID=53972 RepID=A0ABS7P1R7_9NOCA|nr:methyltransferase [Rhodococcus corynebacterioides]MBY6366343.1 methyltransferase [Rhodococcus corynebacterioides]MBY6406746.1 methyltransferase [Rhodococcus corynebacterioides]